MGKRRTSYDELAPSFDRRYELVGYDGIRSTLLGLLGDDRSRRVLEVGCGTGHWLSMLRDAGFSPAGLDASQGMLNRARERNPGATLVLGSAEELPFDAAAFDYLFCVNAIHHFADPRAFLREARRVLGRGGDLTVIGMDPHVGKDRWCVYDYFEGTLEADHERFPSMGALREWMTSAGFEGASTAIAEHFQETWTPERALAGGIDKSQCSQLANLTEQEYEAGIQKIHDATVTAKARAEDLVLHVDLRLYATSARVPA